MGAPVRFDEEKRGAWLALVSAGMGRHAAARQLGVDPSTVRRHLSADPALREAFELAESEAAEKVADVIYREALDGAPWAAQLWVKHRDAARWGDPAQRVAVEVSGSVRHELVDGGVLARVAELAAAVRERAEVVDVESWELEPGESRAVTPPGRVGAEPRPGAAAGGGPPAAGPPVGGPGGPGGPGTGQKSGPP